MFPTLIQFGPLTIHTYGFFVAAGFLVALWLAMKQARREGIPEGKILDLGFYILLAAIVGSRLFFVGINLEHFIGRPLDIFKIWEGGLVFYGGVLLAIPTAVWYVRRHNLEIWRTADIFAPSVAIGHVFGRLGCFAAGCCYGKAGETLPWGVIFSDPECLAPLNVKLHPVQLYESGAEFLNFLVLIALRKRKRFDGQVFMAYLGIYSLLRFTLEFFRGDIARGFVAGGISVSQGISLLLFVAAVAGYILLMKRRRGSKTY